jgi:hypothetical protein
MDNNDYLIAALITAQTGGADCDSCPFQGLGLPGTCDECPNRPDEE